MINGEWLQAFSCKPVEQNVILVGILRKFLLLLSVHSHFLIQFLFYMKSTNMIITMLYCKLQKYRDTFA